MRSKLALLIAAMTLPLMSFAYGQATSNEERTKLFTWFDSLGYPEVSSGKFVELDAKFVGAKQSERPTFGFLQSANSHQFTVTGLNLYRTTYYSGHPEKTRGYEGTFKVLDFTTWVNKQLPKLEFLSYSIVAGMGRMSGADSAFVLSRACAARSLGDQSSKVFDYFDSKVREESYVFTGKKTTSEIIKSKFGEVTLFRTFSDLRDPSVSRPEILARVNDFFRHYPDYASYGENQAREEEFARAAVPVLEKMIREDVEQNARKLKPQSWFTVQGQVLDLIYELRDQNGFQTMEPGGIDVFADRRGENSPAAKLAKLGLAAVPTLLNYLNDVEFTRSLSNGERYGVDHLVMRRCGAVDQILERISCRHLHNVPDYNAKPGQGREALNSEIESWWKEVQSKGERQVLVEATSEGDYDAQASAERLVEVYPDAAFAAISSGLKNAKNEYSRTAMVNSLTKLNTPEVKKFMRDQMQNAPDLISRVYAARVVGRDDPNTAVHGLVDIWEQAKKSAALPPNAWEISVIAHDMLVTGRPEMVDALAKDLTSLAPNIQSQVVFWLSARFYTPYKGEEIVGGAAPKSEKNAFMKAVEALLVSEMENSNPQSNHWETDLSDSSGNPPLNDVAAAALNANFPNKYPFNLTDTKRERDRERAICENVWRREHDLPLIQVPAKPLSLFGPNQTVAALTITSVTVSGKRDLAPEFAAGLVKLNGTVITSKAIYDLIEKAQAEWGSGLSGIGIELERDHGGSGITLSVIVSDAPTRNFGTGWSTNMSLKVDGVTKDGNGSTSSEWKWIKLGVDHFWESVDKALTSPSSASLELRFSLLHRV